MGRAGAPPRAGILHRRGDGRSVRSVAGTICAGCGAGHRPALNPAFPSRRSSRTGPDHGRPRRSDSRLAHAYGGYRAAPVPARNSIKLLTRRARRTTEDHGDRVAPDQPAELLGSPWSSVVLRTLRVKSLLCRPRARHCHVRTGCRSSAGTFKFLHAVIALAAGQYTGWNSAARFSIAPVGHEQQTDRPWPAGRTSPVGPLRRSNRRQ